MIETHQSVTICFGLDAFHKYRESGGNFAAILVNAVQKTPSLSGLQCKV